MITKVIEITDLDVLITANGSAKWSAGIESGKFSIRTKLSQTNFCDLN